MTLDDLFARSTETVTAATSLFAAGWSILTRREARAAAAAAREAKEAAEKAVTKTEATAQAAREAKEAAEKAVTKTEATAQAVAVVKADVAEVKVKADKIEKATNSLMTARSMADREGSFAAGQVHEREKVEGVVPVKEASEQLAAVEQARADGVQAGIAALDATHSKGKAKDSAN